MFSTLFTLSTLAILAAATPTARQASSCTTGALQCCESTTTASDPVAASLLGLLGIVLQDINIPVGLDCSPISVIGVGGGTCSANTVCSTTLGGLISIGCVPVSL